MAVKTRSWRFIVTIAQRVDIRRWEIVIVKLAFNQLFAALFLLLLLMMMMIMMIKIDGGGGGMLVVVF